MNAAVASPPHQPLPMLAVLGWPLPAREWFGLRGAQYARLALSVRSRLLSQVIGAVAALGLFAPSANRLLLLGWTVLLGLSLVLSARSDRSFAGAERAPPGREAMLRYAAITMVNAIVWAASVVLFADNSSESARLELWTVIAMLMTASAVVVPAMPLGTIFFSAIVGGTMVASFLWLHAWEMGGIAALFIVVVIVGAYESARNFLSSCSAEWGVAEHSEVVSLLLREVEEDDGDWLWQVDTQRKVRSVSHRFALALGLDASLIEGESFVRLLAGESWDGELDPSLHELVERLQHREAFANLPVHVTVRGEQRWWEMSGKPRIKENGAFAGFRGVASDVTVERESSEKIAWLARYDTLTGLPNRLLLIEAAGDAMRYAQKWRSRCAFLMIDLDRFKAVNDTLGHMIGDELLAEVSSRIKDIVACYGKGEGVCGRLGGDEFAVVLRDASDLARVGEVARSVIERLSQPYNIDGHMLYVGASVGLAIGPRDGETVEALMRNADLALYRAKDAGGGQHCTYEPELHARAEERRKLEFALRGALERGELVVHYQPVVDAISEKLVSCEALLRWNSPELGLVSPVKFIPIAEDTRLIVPIGAFVLREACREAVNWPPRVKVAVNVSSEQLLDSSFLDTVVSVLAESGLSPQRLELEVTESIFVRDVVTVRAVLERVMALGCGIALDDFGTGYSSLSYLRTFRFTTIKVDRSFVKSAAEGNRESLAIIRAVVAMADALEMSTTAEGVETEEELALVREHGCKKIQGFYFGRPICAADTRALFRRLSPGSVAGNVPGRTDRAALR